MSKPDRTSTYSDRQEAMVKYICGNDPNLDVTQQVLAACNAGDILVPTPIALAERAHAVVRAATGTMPGIVRVQCKTDHWCDFECHPADEDIEVRGTPVSAAEIARWTVWQDYTDPLKGMERIGTYSRWVLGATGMVTLLAGGLAASGGLSLTTLPAKIIYGFAVLCLGLSWAFVSFTIAPHWIQLKRQRPNDFVDKFNEQFRKRRASLGAAASLLGLALALAALVPLFGLVRTLPRSVGIGYERQQSGAFSAKMVGSGLLPSSAVELALSADTAPRTGLPRARGTVDSTGRVQLTISLDSVRASQAKLPYKLYGTWSPRTGSTHTDIVIVP